METFEALSKSVFYYGGTVIMAVLFIYVFITDRKDRKEDKTTNTQVLKELSGSNQNIAESLNLLKVSIDNNTSEYRQHDDRAVEGFGEIKGHLIRIEEKLERK